VPGRRPAEAALDWLGALAVAHPAVVSSAWAARLGLVTGPCPGLGQLVEAAQAALAVLGARSAPARQLVVGGVLRGARFVAGPVVAVMGGLLLGWPVPGIGGSVTRLGQRPPRGASGRPSGQAGRVTGRGTPSMYSCPGIEPSLRSGGSTSLITPGQEPPGVLSLGSAILTCVPRPVVAS
jgi:hypothetical protein